MPVTPESASFFDDINPNIYSGAQRVAEAVGALMPVEVELPHVEATPPKASMPPSLEVVDAMLANNPNARH